MANHEKDEYRICPVNEVSADQVIDFLKTYFTRRNDIYENRFSWWYGNFRNYIPCVAVDHAGTVVGFVGGSPISFRDHGKILRAGALTDLYVDPSSRGHKLGQRLLQSMLDQADVSFGGNTTPVSRVIEERLGIMYIDNAEGYLVILGLRQARAFGRKGAAISPMLKLLNPVYRIWMNVRSTPGLHVSPIAGQQGEICKLIDDDPEFGLYHDEAWVHWRFFENPYSERHYIAMHRSAAVIFRTMMDQKLRRLHVLYCTPAADGQDLDILFRQVLRWGIENQLDLVYAMAAVDTLKMLYRKYASKSFPINSGVMFADGRHMDKAMASHVLQLQLMDSDFDMAYFDQEQMVPCIPA